MVKMIDKEMLDGLLDEWSQGKEQSDFYESSRRC